MVVALKRCLPFGGHTRKKQEHKMTETEQKVTSAYRP